MWRHKGRGWAAFDHKEREKQDSVTECPVEPYPSISKLASVNVAKSPIDDNLIRSFSSVVRSSVGFPPFAGNHDNQIVNDDFRTFAGNHVGNRDNQIINDDFWPFAGNHDNQIMNDDFGAKHHTDKTVRESDVMPVKMLKDIHMWADQNLIENVLAAANNDVDQASVLLKAMASSESNPKDSGLLGLSSSNGSYPCEDKENSLEKNNLVECKLFDGDQEVVMPNYSISVPVEPEWEEEDVYLRHRKDAVRMMRMASQHSRAASNAFLRGDHICAQQYSLKAHDEWVESEKLNAEAAKKILNIRNNNNDIWKIDLHGLHASEAVSALTQHLHKIESEMMLNRSGSSDALAKLGRGIFNSALCVHVSGMETNAEIKKKELPQQRQMILHVITGTGSHSRGQASLPTAVKSFLIENGYRFDDARPGIFAVRPKFRNK